MADPFMEHPTGDFGNAVDAMADAFRRLRELPDWNEWITFCAQGMGPRLDSYHFAEIGLRKDQLRLNSLIDVETVIKKAGVNNFCLAKNGDHYSVAEASPAEAAQILDAIYRHHLGIQPHTGEGDDYAIGAEWDIPQLNG